MSRKILITLVVIGVLFSSYLFIAPRGAEAQGFLKKLFGIGQYPGLTDAQKECFKTLEDWSDITGGKVSLVTEDVYNCIKDILLVIGFTPELKPWPNDIKSYHVEGFQHFYNVNNDPDIPVNGKIDEDTINALKKWKSDIETGEVPPGTDFPGMSEEQIECIKILQGYGDDASQPSPKVLECFELVIGVVFPEFEFGAVAGLTLANFLDVLEEIRILLNEKYDLDLGTVGEIIDALIEAKASIEVDQCKNIEDIQTTVPDFLFQDENGNCVCDACGNIEGVQTFVPPFLIRDREGNCDCKVGGTATGTTPSPTTGGTTGPKDTDTGGGG